MTVKLKMLVFRVLDRLLENGNTTLVRYWGPDASIMRTIVCLRKHNMTQHKHEAYQLYVVARSTRKVSGDIAEVGVYKGGTAKLMSYAQGNRGMHLFDTYEGMPPPTKEDAGAVQKWQQNIEATTVGTLDEVRALMTGVPGVRYYKGLFPETSEPVKNKKFSLVHLDVDFYKATKGSLDFFYPRMNKGGVIISHDYGQFAGVRQAFDEFFSDKPEPLIELSGSQVLVVKI